MKNLISIILAVIVLASCSTTNTFNKGPFQKRKYSKGFYINKKSNTTIASKNKEIAPIIILKEAAENDFTKLVKIKKVESTILPTTTIDVVSDSVKIVLKNGDLYTGVIVDEDESGYSIRQTNGRIVYLIKKDIKELVSLKSNETRQKEEETEVKKAVEPYSYITKRAEPSWIKEKKTRLKAPPSSNSALILFCISLLIAFASPSLAVISLILFAIGLILSVIGFNQVKREPSLYSVKKAKRIMWLHLAPILLLLSLIGLALAV